MTQITALTKTVETVTGQRNLAKANVDKLLKDRHDKSLASKALLEKEKVKLVPINSDEF